MRAEPNTPGSRVSRRPRGGKPRLMEVSIRSDRSPDGLVKPRGFIGRRFRRDRESGQAITEFAIVMFPLLLLVAGIIQFGIGLNFWLDMQRISNQGARWAVVNSWPGCPRNEPVPLTGTNCTGTNTLQTYLTNQALSQGLRNTVTVDVCWADDGNAATLDGMRGSPVRVRLESPFKFVPIVGVGSITLGAEATMRLERDATHITGASGC